MTEILDWERVGKPRAAARAIGSALRQGTLVAFPTESSYLVAAAAVSEAAVARARELTQGRPLELILPDAASARDWLPDLGPAGRRLARRLWPGPLTLVSAEGTDGGLTSRLPEVVRRALTADGALHLRHPAHEAVLTTLRHLRLPLVGAALPTASGDAFGPRDVLAAAGSRLDLMIAGLPRFDRPPTLVEVRGGEWSVRREGAVSAEQLREQLACLIVFVCTGNTCRSPLAEGLCKVRLAGRLGCSVEELEGRGYLVRSAGLAAGPGLPAAAEAIEVGSCYGADLTRHASRQLTLELAARADHLLVMTEGHARALAGQLPPGSARPRLLSREGEDVPDPIGGSREVYEECARSLDACVRLVVDEILAG